MTFFLIFSWLVLLFVSCKGAEIALRKAGLL
jgi:hypothetical protein